MIERPIFGEATTPDGIRAVVFADTWRDHILDPDVGHAELAPHLDSVPAAIAAWRAASPTRRRTRS